MALPWVSSHTNIINNKSALNLNDSTMIFILTWLSFSQSKVFECPVTIFQNPVKIRYEMEKDFIFQPCFFINIQQHNFPSLINTLKHIFQSCKPWLEYIFLTMYLSLPLRVKYFVFSSFDVEISAFLLFSFKLCIPFNWCEEISTSIQLKFPFFSVKLKFSFPFSYKWIPSIPFLFSQNSWLFTFQPIINASCLGIYSPRLAVWAQSSYRSLPCCLSSLSRDYTSVRTGKLSGGS